MIYGRDRERAQLRELLDDAIAGHGSLVLISGEAGIGKTTLADELINEAEERDCLVLSGGCYDLTTTPPYGPWSEALRGYQPQDDQPPVPAWFSDPNAMGQVGSQTALFEETRRFFSEVAQIQPLIVVLEDFHWTDSASLEALRYLGRTLHDTAILLVVTYREDELTRRHELYQLLPLLVRESQAQRIHLHQLDQDDIREIVAGRYELEESDTERLVDHVTERSEGNPFFAEELLQGLEDTRVLQHTADGWLLGNLERARVPMLLRQTIDARLDRLSPETRAILRVAAVIGHIVAIDFWQRVADPNGDLFDDAMNEAVNQHVLEEGMTRGYLQFRHALLREALYESLTLSQRRSWHRLVGETLSAISTADPDEVAHHFQEAGDARAIRWLFRAGVRAEGSYAWEVATTHYEAALALLEADPEMTHSRGWLLLQIGHLVRYSDRHQSLAHLEEAHRIAGAVGDRVLAAASLQLRGLVLCFEHEVGEGLREMATAGRFIDQLSTADEQRANQAIAALFPEDVLADPRVTRGSALVVIGIVSRVHMMQQSYAMWLAFAGRFREAVEFGESLIQTVSDATDDPVMIQNACRDAYTALADAADALGQPETARQWRTRALAAYQTIGHHVLTASTLHGELNHLLTYYPEQVARRRQIAEAKVAAMERGAGALATPGFFGPTPDPHVLLVLEGQWQEACDLALATLGNHSPPQQGARLDTFDVVGIERDDPELAAEVRTDINDVLVDGPETVPGEKTFFCSMPALRLAIKLAIDDGDLDQAHAWLEAYDRWLEWSGVVIGRAEGQLLWARYYTDVGDADRARQHVQQALDQASEPRRPLALIAAHRLLGELNTDAERYDEAIEHLQISLDLAKRCEAPYEQALTLLALAELAAARDDAQNASRLLREARAICERLGAQRSLQRAVQIEAGLRRSSTEHPAGLSSREVEVLEQAATGMTNAEIGEALYISRRTVAQHLRSVYNKLGVNSRAAAVARWAELNN